MKRLNWGMIGGGQGSQIGPAHRLGAAVVGTFDFVAGALDHRADEGHAFAKSLGIVDARAYGDWQEMLAGEQDRDDRVDLVTVATPNATHFEITKAFLEAGFHVLCEKPMTMTVEEGRGHCCGSAEKSRTASAPSITAIRAIRWCVTCGPWWRAATLAGCG